MRKAAVKKKPAERGKVFPALRLFRVFEKGPEEKAKKATEDKKY